MTQTGTQVARVVFTRGGVDESIHEIHLAVVDAGACPSPVAVIPIW
ncbi:hypothetical protein ACFP9V_14585 [Deinococcus radiopugnans]